ncbi:MAG: hypothetical protein RL626_1040 [Pseudomonadota bacterium]
MKISVKLSKTVGAYKSNSSDFLLEPTQMAVPLKDSILIEVAVMLVLSLLNTLNLTEGEDLES